jgi:hypothetical protein
VEGLTMPAPTQYDFFLGGADLEMDAIRALLEQHAPDQMHDMHLRWGARASAYREEIEASLKSGHTPVLVELENDLDLKDESLQVVDHHGAAAGRDKPTSLHQVFALLGLASAAWTRWHELVAANDRGYIEALRECGASPEEIREIRAADRAAQGITPEQEAEAQRAVQHTRTLADGDLTVVRLPHARTAAVTDRLHPALGGPGYRNLLIESPEELNFYGEGMLVHALNLAFPGGWYGGALPDQGFWGHGPPVVDVKQFLLREIERAGAYAGMPQHTG